jgi:hypothetical protein
MKGCSCRWCRSGMHTPDGGKLIQKLIRKARLSVKRALRQGVEPPSFVSRGWTD